MCLSDGVDFDERLKVAGAVFDLSSDSNKWDSDFSGRAPFDQCRLRNRKQSRCTFCIGECVNVKRQFMMSHLISLQFFCVRHLWHDDRKREDH